MHDAFVLGLMIRCYAASIADPRNLLISNGTPPLVSSGSPFRLHLGPISQLCQQLAKKSVWQLRSGLLVGSKDGCFLQVSGLSVLRLLSSRAIFDRVGSWSLLLGQVTLLPQPLSSS